MAPDREGALVVGLVSGSHFVNHTYLVLLPPLIPILTGEFEVGVAAIGLAIGVQGAVNAALQLPFGHVADTYSRTAVLAVSLAVGCLGTVMTALAPTYEWLLVSQAVLGVGIGGHHPAHYPMLAAATAASDRGRAYSVHGFMGSLGFAAPPAVVTGAVALGFSWRAGVLAIAAVGGLYAVVALGVLQTRVSRAVRVPPAADESRGEESRGDESSADGLARGTALTDLDPVAAVRSGLRAIVAVFTAPAILTLAVLATVVSAAGWGIRSYTVVLLADLYRLPDATANLVTTAMFVTGAVLILVGGDLSDRLSAEPVLLGGFAALTLVGGALATAALPLSLVLALTVVLSGTISVSRPARSTLADALSARGDLGKSFALVTIGITAGGAVAPPVFGWVIDTLGVATVFFAIAALGLVSIVLTLALRRYSDGAGVTQRATGD